VVIDIFKYYRKRLGRKELKKKKKNLISEIRSCCWGGLLEWQGRQQSLLQRLARFLFCGMSRDKEKNESKKQTM